ncbi:hypothetical protein EUX98_g6045 [Antrodiella citrinella]|uniref:Amine oxidase domain-containing protein n=1 Tax=Antrodiella citrinella TaxID=2447956 RepID=A0A4S4MPZ2_9APHY|nr:hypothetical protein EUX98_g6045 [Antrodiella citrinella]
MLTSPLTRILALLVLVRAGSFGVAMPAQEPVQASLPVTRPPRDARVLILGGGVAGITAANALHENGISDFIILEARHELGGRMTSRSFGTTDNQYTVELGANWIQGTQAKGGLENPIWGLGKKHNIATRTSSFSNITTFDETGHVDFQDVVKASAKNYARLTDAAGVRVSRDFVDTTARGGYSLTGAQPSNIYEMASEYFQFDWEFAQTPEETSWIASSWVNSSLINPWANNYTFRSNAGGFSEVNAMSVDQRGFKTLVQAEASSFLRDSQVRVNSTVTDVAYSTNGVAITLNTGQILHADYAISTFSLGVLQHNDVTFTPTLPEWKREAIHSMSMGVFTKIFFQFPEKFWFDTEMGLYADRERGRYAVWQSLDHMNYFPGSGIIFVTGDFSKRIEALPDSQVKFEALAVLRSMWHSDPLFRGSYSNWPASFLIERSVNLRANVGERLWFAGEATSMKHFGFLHGAYLEGREIGSAVAECVKEGGCIGLEHVETVKNARPYELF